MEKQIKASDIRNGDKIRIVESYPGYEGSIEMEVSNVTLTSAYIGGQYEQVCTVNFGVDGINHMVTKKSKVYLLERKKSPGQLMYEAYAKIFGDYILASSWDDLSTLYKNKWHRLALDFQHAKAQQQK